MGKRKRQTKRKSNSDRTPPKRRKIAVDKPVKEVSNFTSSQDGSSNECESKDYNELESSVSKSYLSVGTVHEPEPQQDKKKIRFSFQQDDELEGAKMRLFSLRQTKVDMQSSLHKFQQQIKCLNEEIEELHEKLERLVARHTREQVEECSCTETSPDTRKTYLQPAVNEIMSTLKDIQVQEAEARLVGMLQMKDDAEQCLRTSQKQLERINRDITKLNETWEELVAIQTKEYVGEPEKPKDEEKDKNKIQDSSHSNTTVKSDQNQEVYVNHCDDDGKIETDVAVFENHSRAALTQQQKKLAADKEYEIAGEEESTTPIKYKKIRERHYNKSNERDRGKSHDQCGYESCSDRTKIHTLYSRTSSMPSYSNISPSSTDTIDPQSSKEEKDDKPKSYRTGFFDLFRFKRNQ